MKKIAITLGVLWVVLLLGYGTYWLFFRSTTGTGGSTATSTDPSFGTLFPTSNTKTGEITKQNSGSTSSTTDSSGNSDTGTTNGGAVAINPKNNGHFTQITNTAVGGAAIIPTKDGSFALEYAEKASGHLFTVAPGSKSGVKLTNTTVASVQEALWNNTGDSVILRSYANEAHTVQNLLGHIIIATSTTGTAQTGSVSGTLLPSTIKNVVLSPDRTSFFYLNSSGKGVVGITTDFGNKTQKQVWSSPVAEWVVSWPKNDTIMLATKPSATVEGSLYLLNIKTGLTTSAISGIPGLTALANPGATKAVYSQSTKTGFLSYLLDLKTGATDSFPLNTLPEKCVWSSFDTKIMYCAAPQNIPFAAYPDAWYQGSVSFVDILWKIDTDAGTATVVGNSSTVKAGGLDATNLLLDPKEETLYFIDKNTGTVWSLDLTAAAIQ